MSIRCRDIRVHSDRERNFVLHVAMRDYTCSCCSVSIQHCVKVHVHGTREAVPSFLLLLLLLPLREQDVSDRRQRHPINTALLVAVLFQGAQSKHRKVYY